MPTSESKEEAMTRPGQSNIRTERGRLARDRPMDIRVAPLIYELLGEVARQDEKHGPLKGTDDLPQQRLGWSRLALGVLEDETREALQAWRDEREALNWNQTRAEVLQVAAVAIRTLRDAL